MAAIRVVVETNDISEEDLARAVERSAKARQEDGCQQFELFRSIEFPENIVQLEQWASEAAFDAHWQRRLAGEGNGGLLDGPTRKLVAPYHHGSQPAPRRHGQNGVEIYPHQYFLRHEDVWVAADPERRLQSVRWPSRGVVRIVIQGNSSPEGEPDMIQNSIETRTEPGCLQFEHFRSIEFPENTVLLELWDGPEIYDIHYLLRLEVRKFRPELAAPPRPGLPRTHGRAGLEWYQLCWYTLIDGVWEPENPAERMVTVRW